jgi:hypothetical protein
MTPTTTSPRSELHFYVRSRLAIVRDLMVIGLCLALVVGFLAQVWHGPTPDSFRSANETSTLRLAA